MGMPEKSTPFDLLLKTDQLYERLTASLPEQKKARANTRVDIGFRLGKLNLSIAIHNLEEILTEPSYTPVPTVKSWVKGIANMRGHLLPVIDLNKLFNITSETTRKQRRIMAVKTPDNGYVGFLVDAVYGMRQFSAENQLVKSLNIPDLLQPFVTGIYEEDQQDWLAFDTEAFMASPLFLEVGL